LRSAAHDISGLLVKDFKPQAIRLITNLHRHDIAENAVLEGLVAGVAVVHVVFFDHFLLAFVLIHAGRVPQESRIVVFHVVDPASDSVKTRLGYICAVVPLL
jgi:hypothetical protein